MSGGGSERTHVTKSVELRDGAVLWTTMGGSGPPVAFCHGGPGLWDYLEPLAALIEDNFTVVRFDQRGCGRSTGEGPFTIAQAIEDLDEVRRALGIERWAVLGHSWGAELALRLAAQHPDRTTSVIYIAGIGADNSFLDAYVTERDRRLGKDLPRWQELRGRPRTDEEEREWCLLQWRPDFSPATATEHAQALWATRPPRTTVNAAANRELWADRTTHDLRELATTANRPVRMIFGADDPRPWSAASPVFDALPNADRVIIENAGHAPWAEQPDQTRDAITDLLSRTNYDDQRP